MSRTTPVSETAHAAQTAHTLHAIRRQLRDRRNDANKLYLDAAELYLSREKPLRAKALMAHVAPRIETTADAIRAESIRRRIDAGISRPHPTCTLTMIVKNEERSLGAALDSVDTIMDEIVICDTGSTDATVSLARPYGATVLHDPWRDDFSRARNNAIAASSGDWIFWMDADDRLEESCAEPLQKLWRAAAFQGALFCIVNERDNAPPVEFLQVRLFPRKTGVVFEQKIHEQIMYNIARSGFSFIRHPTIRIRHTGYLTPELLQKKALRNKPLLIEELRGKPDDPTLRVSLADCHMTLGEKEAAETLYQTIVSTHGSCEKNSDVYVQALINLGRIDFQRRAFESATRRFTRALGLDESRVEAWYALARIHLAEGNEEKALVCFLKSARITPPLRLTATDNLRIRLESIYHSVDLFLKRNRYHEAELILTPALTLFPMVPQFYTQMAQILFQTGRITESARCFSQSIALSPTNNRDAYRGMAAIYTLLGDNATADGYLHKSNATSLALL